MSDDIDTYGYDKKSAPELRKVIADLYRDNLALNEQKKSYVDGVNEIVKNNKERMDVASSYLTAQEKNGSDAAHEARVKDFLEANGAQTN